MDMTHANLTFTRLDTLSWRVLAKLNRNRNRGREPRSTFPVKFVIPGFEPLPANGNEGDDGSDVNEQPRYDERIGVIYKPRQHHSTSRE